MDQSNNFYIKYILLFIIFLELLVIKVYFLQIILKKLWEALGGFSAQLWSLRVLQKMPLKNSLRSNIRNDKREYCYIIYYQFSKRTSQLYRAKIDGIISRLGEWVSI